LRSKGNISEKDHKYYRIEYDHVSSQRLNVGAFRGSLIKTLIILEENLQRSIIINDQAHKDRNQVKSRKAIIYSFNRWSSWVLWRV